MSVDVLITGKLRGSVSTRTSTNGNPYAVFKLITSDKHNESLLCSCIVFSPEVMKRVLVLADGDAVAVSGEASVSGWVDKSGNQQQGLDVTIYEAISTYHAGRKRKAADLADATEGRG